MPHSVLVVENEHSIREMLRHGLRGLGFIVHLAANDAEAMATYQQHREAISVVILDVEIDDGDGPATLSTFHELDPNLPMVVLNGILSAHSHTDLEAMGALRIFDKPLRSAELARFLKDRILTPRAPLPSL